MMDATLLHAVSWMFFYYYYFYSSTVQPCFINKKTNYTDCIFLSAFLELMSKLLHSVQVYALHHLNIDDDLYYFL